MSFHDSTGGAVPRLTAAEAAHRLLLALLKRAVIRRNASPPPRESGLLYTLKHLSACKHAPRYRSPLSLATRCRHRQRRQRDRRGPTPTAIVFFFFVVVPVEDGVPRSRGARRPQNVVGVDAGLSAAGRRGGRDVVGERGASATVSKHHRRCRRFACERGRGAGGAGGGMGPLEVVRCGGWRRRRRRRGGGREDEGREEFVGVGGARRGADWPPAVLAGAESRQLR